MKNLFVIGKAGAGKDTASYYFAHVYNVRMFAVAERIKMKFKELYPNLDPRLNRDKLIEIGQGCKDMLGQDCWVKLTMDDINNYLMGMPNGYVIISDGRYQVEYDYFVGQLGYEPIRITCPDEIRLQRLQDRDGTTQDEALLLESNDLDDAIATSIDNSTDETTLFLELDSFIATLI